MDMPLEWDKATCIEYLQKAGFDNVRRLEDGTWAGTTELMFTRAICLGLNYHGYAYRFCFSDRELATSELQKLTSIDDVPTGFIARRPS